MTKREKLARAVGKVLANDPWGDLPGLDESGREAIRPVLQKEALGIVDAILAELREADDKMIAAACRETRHWEGDASAVWQAMIDAIGDEA